jgi:acetyltransferase-like isoleucine patch superfamily enzyme
MNHIKIIILGQGSIALEFSEYLEDHIKMLPSLKWEVIGYISMDEEENRFIGMYDDLGEIYSHVPHPDCMYLMACDPCKNFKHISRLKHLGAQFMSFIHPEATLGNNVEIGEGVIIGPFSYIQSGVRIGKFNILEMYSIVSMFSVIGDYNYIQPKAYLGSGCVLGQLNFIGSNVNIPKGKVIGNENIISMGISVASN